MATIEELRRKANLVANATEVGENTADRVGGALQDAANLISDVIGEVNNVNGALEMKINEAKDSISNEALTREREDGILQRNIDALQSTINAIVGNTTNESIENLNEVLSFLSGISERDTLESILEKLKQDVIEILEDHVGEEANERGIIDGQLQNQIDTLKSNLSQILGVNETGGISSFDNVISFLRDITVEDDSLVEMLRGIDYRISQIRDNVNSEISQVRDNVNGEILERKKLSSTVRDFKDSFYNPNGSFLNISNIYPLGDGYHTIESAVSMLELRHIPEDDRKGLIITFEVSGGKWEDYRYVGDETSDEAFASIDMWQRYAPELAVIEDNPQYAINETKRKENETLRKAAEQTRQSHEAERIRNEEGRVRAEEDRANAEVTRHEQYQNVLSTVNKTAADIVKTLQGLDDKNERLTTLIDESTTFVNRMQADSERIGSLEDKRASAEEQRVINENSRIAAETQRQEATTDAIQRVNEAIANVRNGEDGADGRFQIVHHEPDDNVFALTPNVMHVWGTQDSLELSLNTDIEEDGILAEYAFQFTCPSYVGTNLVLPSEIKWYNGLVVVPQADKTYQASIVNNIIVMGEA